MARKLLLELLPYESIMAIKQMAIGYVKDPGYRYRLDLKDETPIKSNLRCFRPIEEEWLGNHLDELVVKRVVSPIFPHKC